MLLDDRKQEIELLNLPQLKDRCRKSDLPVNGKKEELVQRLIKAGVRSASASEVQPKPRSTPRRGVRASAPLEETAVA